MLRRFGLSLVLALISVGASAAEQDIFWFQNLLQCGGVKVNVRSQCQVISADAPVNLLCMQQQLVLTQPDGTVLRRDLLEHEPSRGESHVVTGVTCGDAGARHFLYISLGNGGNCDTCENEAVMGLDGRWKRYGQRWLKATPQEKKSINTHLDAWQNADGVLITNTVRE